MDRGNLKFWLGVTIAIVCVLIRHEQPPWMLYIGWFLAGGNIGLWAGRRERAGYRGDK